MHISSDMYAVESHTQVNCFLWAGYVHILSTLSSKAFDSKHREIHHFWGFGEKLGLDCTCQREGFDEVDSSVEVVSVEPFDRMIRNSSSQ